MTMMQPLGGQGCARLLDLLEVADGNLGTEEMQVFQVANIADYLGQASRDRVRANLFIFNHKRGKHGQSCRFLTSLIGDVDEDRDQFEISVYKPNMRIEEGYVVRGEFSLDHIRLTFETTVKKIISEDRLKTIRFDFPHSMFRLQRRDSFRVPVLSSDNITITLDPAHEQMRNIRAVDLSCGGVGAMMLVDPALIHKGQEFPKASVRFGSDDEFYLVPMKLMHGSEAADSISRYVRMDLYSTANEEMKKSKNVTESVEANRKNAKIIQVGLKFGPRMPPGFDRQVSLTVNELARRHFSRSRN